MMLYCGSNDDPKLESYSSYKKRKFHEYEVKMKKVLSGIDDSSLKKHDKKLLRIKLSEIFDL